jgi:hypothetical protein
MQLCAQAAVEPDPEKLMALVGEINGLLGEKECRLGIFLSRNTGSEESEA